MPLVDVPQYALQTSITPKCSKYIIASFQTQCCTHARSDGISPSLPLMSPSNFHKMCTFLRVTNACHCLMMMTYTNIQRIAFLFHYFFHTKLIPKPPASAARLTRKLPTMCLAPRRPPEKRHLSGGCWLSPPPSQVIHIYIYIGIYIYTVVVHVYIYIYIFFLYVHAI